MGLYINPPGSTKEEWLNRVQKIGDGKVVTKPIWPGVDEDYLPVCWVSNGEFSAAGICYSWREMERFTPFDGRVKVWLHVKRDALRGLIPELDQWISEI